MTDISEAYTGWIENSTADLHTAEVPEVEEVKPSCEVYDFTVSVVIMGCLCLFGWVGNTLSFLVMWPDRHRSATSFALMILAVIDNMVLVFRFMMKTIPSFCVFHHICPSIENYIGVHVSIVGWGLNNMAQQATTWNAVIMTVIRYISVCVPLRAKQLTTVRITRNACIINVLASVAFNIPRMLERVVVYDKHGTAKSVQTDLAKRYSYSVGYKQVAFYLVFYIIPLTILIVLTFLLIQALRKSSKKRQELTQKAQERQDITITLVAVVVVFIICQIFTPLRRTITFAIPQSKLGCPYPYHYFNEFNSTAVVLNSAINFVLYCVFGKRFRRNLKTLLTCSHKIVPLEITMTPSQIPGTLGHTKKITCEATMPKTTLVNQSKI